MSSRQTLLKRSLLGLVLLSVALLLFVYLALPAIVQTQAQKFIAERTGHQLTLDRPTIDPLHLNVRLGHLLLREPDGQVLLEFHALDVSLAANSLWRRAWVFDRIRLEQPQAAVVLHADGRLNWSALIDALQDKQKKPDQPLPRLEIRSVALVGGRLDLKDERARFATSVVPLDFELHDLSTLDGDSGHYQLAAGTALGAHVLWQGEATLKPVIAAHGSLRVEGLDLARLAPYLDRAAPLATPAGMLNVATDYRAQYGAGHLEFGLEHVEVAIAGLTLASAASEQAALACDSVELHQGGFDLASGKAALGALRLTGARVSLPVPKAPAAQLKLGSLVLEQASADLRAHRVTASGIVLADGELRATRDAAGTLDLLAALHALPQLLAAPAAPFTATAAAPVATAPIATAPIATAPVGAGGAASVHAPAAQQPWHFQLAHFAVNGFVLGLRDLSVAPAADLEVDDVHLDAQGLSEQLAVALPVSAAFRVRDGGDFHATGRLVPAPMVADFDCSSRIWHSSRHSLTCRVSLA